VHVACSRGFVLFRPVAVALQSAISAYSAYSAIGRYHARQGARYGEHGRAVRSREALITSDGLGCDQGVGSGEGAQDYRNKLMLSDPFRRRCDMLRILPFLQMT